MGVLLSRGPIFLRATGLHGLSADSRCGAAIGDWANRATGFVAFVIVAFRSLRRIGRLRRAGRTRCALVGHLFLLVFLFVRVD